MSPNTGLPCPRSIQKTQGVPPVRKGKAGRIPDDCAPVRERLQCSAETWLDFVQNYRLRFRNEAGLATTRQAYATDSGQELILSKRPESRVPQQLQRSKSTAL